MGEVAQTYKKTALINNKWNKPQGLLTFHLKLTRLSMINQFRNKKVKILSKNAIKNSPTRTCIVCPETPLTIDD